MSREPSSREAGGPVRGRAPVHVPALVAGYEAEVDEREAPKGSRFRKILLIGTAVLAATGVAGAGGYMLADVLDRPTQGSDTYAEQPGVVAAPPGESPTRSATATPTPTRTSRPAPSQKNNSKPPLPITTSSVPRPTTSQAAPNRYENRIIMGPNGARYHIKNGRRFTIPNVAISLCISARSGTGDPTPVSGEVVNNYPLSERVAHCPYEMQTRPGRLFFVTEEGANGFVWLVRIENGVPVKHHAGNLCPNPTGSYPLDVHQVPSEETHGHDVGPDWFANDADCAAMAS